MPIPTPAQNSSPMVGKSLKGLENIQSKVHTFYLCLHTLSTGSVYKYTLKYIYRSTYVWFRIKWGYQNIIWCLYTSGICMGKGKKDEVFISLVASFKFICKNKELKWQPCARMACAVCCALVFSRLKWSCSSGVYNLRWTCIGPFKQFCMDSKLLVYRNQALKACFIYGAGINNTFCLNPEALPHVSWVTFIVFFLSLLWKWEVSTFQALRILFF